MGIAKALRGKLERGNPPAALHGAGVLDSASRFSVYRAAVETPGLGVRDISRRIGKGETSVRWHLRRLSRAGIVAVGRRAPLSRSGPSARAEPARASTSPQAEAGRARRESRGKGGAIAVVPTGVYSEGTLGILEMANGPRGGVIAAISASPGAKASELAAALGTSPESLSEALAEMCADGLLRRVRDGKASRYFIADELASARSAMRAEAGKARDRLVGILQAEAPGLISVSSRGSRVVAECPWGVEVFNLPFE